MEKYIDVPMKKMTNRKVVVGFLLKILQCSRSLPKRLFKQKVHRLRSTCLRWINGITLSFRSHSERTKSNYYSSLLKHDDVILMFYHIFKDNLVKTSSVLVSEFVVY
jgi:hypothetical protein